MTTHTVEIASIDTLAAELAADLDRCFERFVLAYQDRIYAFAVRLSGNTQDAEEIAQDAFVRAYRALAGYSPDRIERLALRPWLYQITLNVFRNRVRGRRVQTVPLDDFNTDHGPQLQDHRQMSPEAIAEQHEHTQELSVLLHTLPERYRAAVVLRHVEGFDYQELAELLGQPVGTVKSNVHRGTRLLRESLTRQMDEVGNA